MKNAFSLPYVYAIVNLDDHPDAFTYVKQLAACGAKLIQLRTKALGQNEFSELARGVVLLNPTVQIIINDSPEVCKKSGAAGVHLGQGDMPPKQARELLGPKAIIGFSTHDTVQLQQAPVEYLNYLAIGPVFESPTKSGHAEPIGLAALSEAVRIARLPLVAIGGITTENAESVYKTGVDSVAVVSELARAADLQAALDRFASCARIC